MALPSDKYWDDLTQQPAVPEQPARPPYSPPTQAAANEKIDQQVQGQVGRNLQNAISKSQEEYYKEEARKPTWSRMPYLVMNELVDMPNNFDWNNMSVLDKAVHLGQEQNKAVWGIIKSLPKMAASMPKHMALGALKTEQSIYDLEMAGFQKIYPKIFGKELPYEDIEKATGRGTTRIVNVLGKPEEIRGVAESYREGIEDLKIGEIGSVIKATGESSMDLAMALTGANIAGSASKWLLRPKFAKVPGTPTVVNVSGVDYQALTKRQKTAVAAKYAEKKIVSKITGNKNVIHAPIDKKTAKLYGITTKDTFVRVSKVGKGMDEYSIVKKVKGNKENLEAKYGKSKVIEGETGMEIKLHSEFVKRDYQTQSLVPRGSTKLSAEPVMETIGMTPTEKLAWSKMTDMQKSDLLGAEPEIAKQMVPSDIPGWGKMTDVQKAEIMGAEPMVAKEVIAKPEIEVDPFAPTEVPETPSLMDRPKIGWDDSPVNEKMVGQVINLADNRGISDGIIQTISKAQNGKININELTRQELYEVSETIKAFPDPSKERTIFDLPSRADPGSYFKMSGDWMDAYELKSIKAGQPQQISSEIRVPIELGTKDYRYFQSQWQEKFREIGGKYASSKYEEEARLIGEYVKGNKDIILENKILSAETKAELAEIGDWFRKYFAESFSKKELGLLDSRFIDAYLPEYAMLEGSPALYKETEIPKELAVASQFERKGQLNVLHDNIFVVADIYAGMVGKIKFLKPPYDRAQKEMAKLPPNVHDRMNNWIQETMGRAGEAEKQLDTFGKSLSKITKGWIPEDIFPTSIRRAMSFSYGTGLGLPKVMPPIRNVMMQSGIFPFADFGPDYLMYVAKEIINPKQLTEDIKDILSKGLEVKGGVMYGRELGQVTGRGPIGKIADKYEKFSLALIKPYGKADLHNRARTAGFVRRRFNKNWDLLRRDKISVEEFERAIDMEGHSPVVQQMLRKLFKDDTKQSLREAEILLQKTKLDEIQYPYRKGGVSQFHHGLTGKALGQFSQYTWGFATMIKNWAKRGQWDKLVRLLGTGEAFRRSAEETLNIDVSGWVGAGPLKVPISPMMNIMMGTTEEMQDVLTNKNNAKAFNQNYKKIMNAVMLFGGPITGPGVQRWKNVKYAVERYERSESGKSPFPLPYDPSNPDRMFAIWTKPITKGAIPSVVRTVTFGELLAYGFGFETMEGKQSWDASSIMKEGEDKKRVEIKKALNYLEKGQYEKFNDTIIENQLNADIVMNNIDSQMKSILQRHFESLSMKDKYKYYPIVGHIIYGE